MLPLYKMQREWNIVVFLSFVWNLTLTSAFIGVIAPGKIRLGTDQKIFLLGFGLDGNDRDYTVTMSPGNRQSHTFYRQTHTVQNGVLTTISINIDPSDIVPESAGDVTLRVRSTRQGGFDRRENIRLDKSPGYLFIQLDKPLYTSRQTVKYRVIAVDEDLKWAPWPVQVSLMNPRGHLIDRITKSARDAFTGAEFSLSRNPMKGPWKIRASYTNFSTDSIATFEVRDYTLPRFSVKVKCNSTSVYTENTSPLKVSVKAEYVYGRPVHGRISVTLFARAWEDHVIYDRQQYQLDNSGAAEIIYNDEEIMDQAIMTNSPVDLYVAINVTEDGTDIVLKKEFKVATFADYPFTLSVNNKKEYYQPGLPYNLELEAQRADGKVAKNVAVDIEVTGQQPASLRTNNKGGITLEVATPQNGTVLQITYRPEGLSLQEITFTVSAVDSQNSQYIKVSAEQRPQLNQGLPVTVSYTSPPGLYFIVIASRGQVVYQESFTSGTNGEDVRTIPREVLKDMIPSARILVFYVANEHVVADSLLVDMGSDCREEVSLSKVGDSLSYKPKDTGQIRIRGGLNMTVGLVAVDKGVFALKYEKSITRKKMIENLASHDIGMESGDGANCLEIFESAGFTLMYGEDYRWAISGDLHSRRGRPEASDDGADNSVLRSFFPESWMFQEETLNSTGESIIDVTYPDSITTWIMYAVGVSHEKGICVSPVKKVMVTKDFFIDLDIPFKVVKLEEVRAKITVSNYLGYDTGVVLSATVDGLCMLDTHSETMTYEEFMVPNGGKVTKMFNLLPVNAGSFVVRAEAETESGIDQDAIEKKIVVVCEGEPKTKSITFSLDPRGEPRNDLTVRQTVNRNIQITRVNMAFPEEAVPESEKIQITASGDLLGDVIGNFVLGNHFPSDFDGVEYLMMELAPSCYGLQYLARLGSLTPEVLHKGRKHIRYALTELLKYRTGEGAFSLEEFDPDYDTETSTWFTSFVLKTLCAAKSILAIDEDIIHTGYTWLLSQVTGSRSRGFTVEEVDPREIPEEGEHVMAEILLSSYSCSHQMTQATARYRHSVKQWYIVAQRSRYRRHRSRLTLAKVTYTLLNLNENHNAWRSAARRLRSKKLSSGGYIYWSDDRPEGEEHPTVYTDKPTSETIETTAYALLVFVKVNMKYSCSHRRPRSRTWCRRLYVDPEKIAAWLVLWRNGNGLFVSATDTAIATEALAKYRQSKRIPRTNLNVDVSTSPNETFNHTLVFEEDDAFQPQSLPDVPLGQRLHVQTTGSGLGQMHVDAIYNTPIDVNADCRFDVTVQRYNQNFDSIQEGRTGLCSVCGTRLTCPKGDNFVCQRDSTTIGVPATNTYCLNVCMKYNSRNDHGKLFIKVRMLSGYVPNECDLQELEGDRVVKASYEDVEDYVHIHLKRVSATEEECVGFRINKIRHVFRIKPALVTVKSFNVEEWTCPRQYAADDESVSRPFYCSTQIHNQNRGCTCINDACVQCSPGTNLGLSFYRNRGRQSSYVFRLRAAYQEDQPGTGAKHLVFDVEEVVKSCLGNVRFENRQVIFVTKKECGCPIFEAGQMYWIMGKDYNTYTDPEGNVEYRFFLNSETFLLSARRADINFDRQSREIRMAIGNPREKERCPC